MPDYEAILMIAASELEADLYYATGFLAPDPFIYLQKGDRKILVMSDLEIDRARAESRADEVLSYSRYEDRLKEGGMEKPDRMDVLDSVLSDLGIRSLLVPGTFGVEYTDGLRERGYVITFKKAPFFEERAVKSAVEVENITEAQRLTEGAMDAAVEAIRIAQVRDGVLYLNGEVLTAERVKRIVGVRLMEQECIAAHTIVACGDQACDPHHRGSGPLRAGETIVIDIFPHSTRTGYYADITRTVVKGRASDQVRRMYEAVVAAQALVCASVKDGADGAEIHAQVTAFFEERGFKSGDMDGRMQGFFHGTGHGVGLDVHEPPRISKKGDTLKAGNVVTNEPGLYYVGVGGVRVEDLLVVTEDGCRNLTAYPKVLEV